MTYVTDMSQLGKCKQIRGEYVTSELPTATLVEVKGLSRPDAMIEISAIAIAHK
jgi:enamine deaminase RidA (YjgF/YER057c/UK114 family)